MPIDLKKYLAEAEEQLRPALETRIGRLAKEQREEQLYGAEKLQQAGRFTSGFRTSWMERVMDIYAGYKEQARGETGEKALSLAQFLTQLAQQAEQAERDRLLRERELTQQATLTREGYALQRALATLGGGGVAGGVSGVSAPIYRPTTTPTVAPTVAPKTTTAPSTTTQAYARAINTYYASLGQAQAYKPAITAAGKRAFGRAPGGVFY